MKSSTSTTSAIIGLALCAACSTDTATTAAVATADPAAVALNERVALLEHRKSLVHDIKDIKRLQRAYGYYVDQALWDEVTNLFAADGTIEIGLDGVYVGKPRIREYLYALGGGHSGLAHGVLNEHMQLMPVITVAPDGLSAKGRWRAIIMAGELGHSAIWGEGPYENEYVKEGGVWKLKKVHWFQTVVVPYEGGWQVNEDINGGKWVSAELPPDRPSTVEYDTWPSVWLPPFHFANPVVGERPPAPRAPEPTALESAEALAARAAVLTQEVARLEDQNAIESLQRTYGFYIDEALWGAAAELFSDDATAEIGASGVFAGKARIAQLLRAQGPEFPQTGRLRDRMQLQPVVHVAPDGLTAKGRWRLFAQEAQSGQFAHWGVGTYENEYVKDNGVWKISRLHAYHRMYTPYEDGWGKTALANEALDIEPDHAPSVAYAAYPDPFAAAFHYENPVTGVPVFAGNAADFASPAEGTLEQVLAVLDDRIERLEDMEELERLNAVYGYYLAHNQWDNLTGIFSPDGSIEIAMRGVYVGAASVRRNLNLYGEAGIHFGLLHNHMQYQPVITLSEDGQSAKMRSRAFSIMGQYEAYSMWMGGVYENDFEERDGIWMLTRDQVFNTYFTQYPVGWKDLALRPPPGITDSNPPDLPPTASFDMYPGAFLVPFHYPHPVTGEAVTGAPAQ